MKKIILLLILTLAFFLRFWKLDSYPALNADEAAIGYNAFSLIETGKDEHGNPWPIHFQSFNDYKPGLYFYLVLPFVKFLGLNVWSVRIPNAILGVMTVFVIYSFVKQLKINNSLEIGNKRSLASFAGWKLEIEEIAAFMLAISPWHIHFSRGGWEANVATFFITLGVWLFLKSLKRPKFLVFSSLSFVLSLYTYHSARIVVPLLGLGILFIYRDFVKKNLRVFLFAGFLGLVAILPLLKDFTKSEISSRAAGVGLFADTGPLSRINEQRGEHAKYSGLPAKILHNKLVNYGLALIQNWSEHYHGEFLFLSGDDIQRDKVPETGQMYLFDILFLLVGFLFLVKISAIISPKDTNLIQPAGARLVLWWLIVAPTAAALTFQSPHALRAQNMVIPLVIISSYALVALWKWFKKQSKYLSVIGHWSLVILIFWQFARYQHMYWVHMAKEYPFSSQYGVKELVSYIKEEQDKYQKIIITDRYDQPYILFLFYLKYSPKKFQADHILTQKDKFGFSTVRSFDKYEFRSVNYDVDQPGNPRSLIVGTDEEIPKEANIVKQIYGTNGYKYFEVVAN